jgi:hypothetical protein
MPLYTRIPATHTFDCWTSDRLTQNEVKKQIAYDKANRWGQSLFVDGKCVHVSEYAGHTPEVIRELESEIKERMINP